MSRAQILVLGGMATAWWTGLALMVGGFWVSWKAALIVIVGSLLFYAATFAGWVIISARR